MDKTWLRGKTRQELVDEIDKSDAAIGKKNIELTQLRAQLATANERIGELETNISEGNLLMQRFTDGDILYSHDEIPLTMQGLGRKLNSEQQHITKLTAERDTLRAALRPIPEAITELVHIATNHGAQYPHQERYVIDVMDLATQAAAALGDVAQEGDDEGQKEKV